MTCGAISDSANSRTALRRWICTGVYSKSTALDYRSLTVAVGSLNNLFLRRIPLQRAALAVTIHRHAASDSHAEADVERAIRFGGAADGIEKILNVRFRFVRPGASIAQYLGGLRAVYLLRQIADLLAACNGPVGAEHIFG